MIRIKTKHLLDVKKQLVEKQKNRCAICGMWFGEYPTKNICVDHDHKTGAIRGALCRNCNQFEGKILTIATRSKRDGTPLQWLTNLVVYWVEHSENLTGLLHPLHKTAEEQAVERKKKARANYAKKKARENLKGG